MYRHRSTYTLTCTSAAAAARGGTGTGELRDIRLVLLWIDNCRWNGCVHAPAGLGGGPLVPPHHPGHAAENRRVQHLQQANSVKVPVRPENGWHPETHNQLSPCPLTVHESMQMQPQCSCGLAHTCAERQSTVVQDTRCILLIIRRRAELF